MYLTWRELPYDWPKYTSPSGRHWRLADDGYWWLLYTNLWHRAASKEVSKVLGVPVPPEILRQNRQWLTGTGSLNAAAAIGIPPRVIETTAYLDAVYSATKPAAAAPTPSIPPDEYRPSPDDCWDCHRDDEPLYDGLCRYCRELRVLRATAPPAFIPVKQRSFKPSLTISFALFWLIWLILVAWSELS